MRAVSRLLAADKEQSTEALDLTYIRTVWIAFCKQTHMILLKLEHYELPFINKLTWWYGEQVPIDVHSDFKESALGKIILHLNLV